MLVPAANRPGHVLLRSCRRPPTRAHRSSSRDRDDWRDRRGWFRRRRATSRWKRQGLRVISTAACTVRMRPQRRPPLQHSAPGERTGDRGDSRQRILMLWPTINPDGHRWRTSRCRGRHPDATAPMPSSSVRGHDNNRDAMLNMVESCDGTRLAAVSPTRYVHHQSAPFPTHLAAAVQEPIATRAVLMSREANIIGMAIAKRLEEEGKVGATTWALGMTPGIRLSTHPCSRMSAF